MTITITHTYAEGTLLDGTTKPDFAKGTGPRQVLDTYAWRWGHSIGCWYQRNSRDRPAYTYRIERTAEQLRELGFTVEVSIDNEPRPMSDQEAARADRMDGRAAALHDKADRRASAAAGRQAAADQIANSIPFGQPILVGHHSERRHRRDLDRMHTNQGKALQLGREADQAAAGAASAERHMQHRYNPVTVANRIHELQAELRRYEREMGPEASEATVAHYEPLRADAATRLQHWQQVRAEQIASGEVVEYGPDNVHVGDWVGGWGSGWYEVAKVNRATVTCNTQRSAMPPYQWLTNKVPYRRITGLRTAQDMATRRAATTDPAEAGGERS